MGWKKMSVIFLLLLLNSCNPREIRYLYAAELVLVNNTNRDLAIFKDGKYFKKLENDKWLDIFNTPKRNNMDGFTLEDLINEGGKLCNDVSIYEVVGDSEKFLKKWTYEERKYGGRQLFRLLDSDLEIYYVNDFFYKKVLYTYIFTINPEDVGL